MCRCRLPHFRDRRCGSCGGVAQRPGQRRPPDEGEAYAQQCTRIAYARRSRAKAPHPPPVPSPAPSPCAPHPTPPHLTPPHPTPRTSIRIYEQVEIAAARAEKKTWEAEDLGEPSASLFLGNLSWSIDEESIRKLFEGCGEIQRIKWHEREGQFTGKAFLDFDSVDSATKAAAKSGQDLKGRPVRITFSKGGNGGAAGGKGAGASGRVERPYKPEGAKPDGCVELFCGNLPWSIDDDKITDFFKDCGTVTATRWLNDKETGDFKGVGWVTFSSTEEVDKAVEMGGEQLDGRPIRIDYAGQKKAAAAWGGGGSW